MKKTISINISGIIFHVEEDAYDVLKSYLESINVYFSSFEESKEIISDIESRIAEIFLSKLNDGSQVVTLLMIEEIQQTMGTISDFKEVMQDGEEASPGQEPTSGNEKETKSEPQETQSIRKLYRNTQQKVIAGVASGIADYFSVDPLWIRLLFLAMFFNLLFGPLTGFTLLAYILLWIILPATSAQPDDKKVKKLYRNSEKRVLGGVAGGLAAYFGMDISVVRLLLVLTIFAGGAGLWLYIILWIITPEAKSLTEKMEMQGEPVTLSNIQNTIKKNASTDEKDESIFVRLFLFPFRLFASVFNFLGKGVSPLFTFIISLIRIFAGVIIIIIGISLLFALLVATAALLGVGIAFSNEWFSSDFPVQSLLESINPIGVASALLVIFIPIFLFIMLGFIFILNRRIGKPYQGWMFLGIWLLALMLAVAFIPSTINDFKYEGFVKYEQAFDLPENQIPLLKLTDYQPNIKYDAVNLKLRGHSDSLFVLKVRVEARGKDREQAEKNAASIRYEVVQENTNFEFPETIEFNETSFRFQDVDAIFYIPFGRTFRMDEELSSILTNTLHLDGYSQYQMSENDWLFTESGLKCLTCKEENERNESDTFEKEEDDFTKTTSLERWLQQSGEERSFDFQNFEYLEMAAFLDVTIVQDETYEVRIKGRDLEDVFLKMENNKLKIEYKKDWEFFEKADVTGSRVKVFISAPKLSSIRLTGLVEGQIGGFKQEEMSIEVKGASELLADVNVNYLAIELEGASRLDLKGRGDELKASVEGAGRLRGLDYQVENGDIKVRGASKAEINATEELSMKATGLSTIRYKGTDRVTIDADELSSVRKY